MNTVGLSNAVSGPTTTSRQYYAPLVETQKSTPLSHFGYPNRFWMPRERPTTAGWLTGDKLEFPRDVFEHSDRHPVFNDKPIYVGGNVDDWPAYKDVRRDV